MIHDAVVVVYLRDMLGLPRGALLPNGAEVLRLIASRPWLLRIEQSREVATIVMLAAIGFISATRWPARFGAFLVAFGVWDIAYYIALVVMVRFPPSLLTLDMLFLIPAHPWWYLPVWLPVAISCLMIALGIRLFMESHR
jgi:hypothetical protein